MIEDDRYIEGFLAGQAVAYCERVNTGLSLTAQLSCAKRYADKLLSLAAQEGCEYFVEHREPERVAIWIYRDKLVKQLIEQARSASEPPSARDIWSTGKLFGYADREVINFIERSRQVSFSCRIQSAPLFGYDAFGHGANLSPLLKISIFEHTECL